MAITIDESRETLTDSVMWNDDFLRLNVKLDRATRAIGNRISSETDLLRSTTTENLSSGTAEYTVSATGFLSGHQATEVYETTNFRRLRTVSWENLRVEEDLSVGNTGRPELITWLSPTKFRVYPTPDDSYTLGFSYRQPFTVWKPGAMGTYSATTTYYYGDWVQNDGDPDSLYYQVVKRDGTSTGQEPSTSSDWEQITDVSATVDPKSTNINIPDRWVDEMLHIGAKYYLLRGAAHSHPDARGMDVQVEDLIRRIRGSAIAEGVWLPDEAKRYEDNYGPAAGTFYRQL